MKKIAFRPKANLDELKKKKKKKIVHPVKEILKPESTFNLSFKE
jgi:hypothetical protein